MSHFFPSEITHLIPIKLEKIEKNGTKFPSANKLARMNMIKNYILILNFFNMVIE